MKQAPKLTSTERGELQILHDKGYSARAIARVFGRSPNTIAAELKRNQATDNSYNARKADNRAYVRRKYAKYQGKKIEENSQLRTYVIAGLQAGWNPDEISGCMKREARPFYASKTAVYDWLYSAYGQPYCQYLASRQYRPKPRKAKKTERVMIPNRVDITARPQEVGVRSRPGDWEADTVVSGKRTGSTAALTVAQERLTKLVGGRLIPDLRPVSFAHATTLLLADKHALTLTLDNGMENRDHASITDATGVQVYFCTPYSSWQKGGVENVNKMLRRYFPKGCDLGQFDQAFVDAVCDRLNKKPRKVLGYKSALQLAEEKGVIRRVS